MPDPTCDVVVYGATGFTGRLVCRELARLGTRFAIAGRDGSKLEALAKTFDPTPTVDVAALDDGPGLARMAERGRVVLDCAGPFASLEAGTGEDVTARRSNDRRTRVERQHQALDPSLRHVTVRGEKFTRVVVGPYSRDEAAAIRRQLKTNDGVDAFIAQSCDDKASPSCIAGSDG